MKKKRGWKRFWAREKFAIGFITGLVAMALFIIVTLFIAIIKLAGSLGCS